ncbi:hypothetical protein [Mycobacteroides abscessus]|uniref:hypothetical protein n=1 Tax=Mycobacteroides abscessus TaxID=36809 RepID=UPI0003A2181C|nr:hypothetical protein [Mycobacteroides abscessus]BBZ82308.1 hypothetical protein MABM_22240 [Mycobacteroides abscessus]
MLEDEAPLTPDERLAIAALYASLTVSQNRTVPGLLVSETPCYADLNIRRPETLSHKRIPAIRLTRGIETC